MQRLHSLTGWAFLLIFLATGAYLRRIFPNAYEADETIRFLFRANRVYILFASLLNILAARVTRPDSTMWSRRVSFAGSTFLLLSPLIFLAAFLIETSPASPERPLTVVGAFLTLLGVLLLVRPSKMPHF